MDFIGIRIKYLLANCNQFLQDESVFSSTDETVIPKLQPPGAGLPKPELFIARCLFALNRWTGSRAAFDARFRREREIVRALVERCDADSGARRVLIRRPPGLEDSSRYWSVWMTLDHLRIVQSEFARVIGDLTRGIMPAGKASTAAVKPDPLADATVIRPYENSCNELLAVAAAAPDLKTRLRFGHPWFGPLDAAGWHALGSGHLAIHRVQIERICAELAK